MLKTKGGKIIIAAVCAALLVAGSVMGTMAYLTSQDSVTNTFTVGQVGITMDETKVDGAGNAWSGEGQSRVKTNEYKLMPGHTYIKDPTIHVAENSETCYLFVKLDNQIAAIVDDTTVENQITGNGWTLLAGTTNVYYRSHYATDAADVVVFRNFKVKGSVDNATLNNYAGKQINVTAYAVQMDGFDNAAAAWSATFGATQTTGTTEA